VRALDYLKYKIRYTFSSVIESTCLKLLKILFLTQAFILTVLLVVWVSSWVVSTVILTLPWPTPK
jgi:hypothetical protein